jgi:phosphatidylserine decarboxylase
MKFAPEGYPFIVFSLLFSVIAAIILLWVIRKVDNTLVISLAMFFLGISFVSVVFMAFFFRDPDRVIPAGEGLYVSPADGRVIGIRSVPERKYVDTEATEISIFMSPLDVHVNRSPCDGRVAAVRYSPGTFMAAYKDDASIRNENIVMVIENEKGKVLVRQVAGFVARRAVCRVKEGDMLKRGERYGIIKFSSRLDVYLPKSFEIKVNIGDKTKAGETIIAVAKDGRQ